MPLIYIILAAEVAVLIGFRYFYHLAINGKILKNNLVSAKIFLAYSPVFQFSAGGLVFSALILLISFFESGPRAMFLRSFSVVPFLVMGWMGVALGLWTYFRLKAPPSEKDYRAAEQAVEQVVDGAGWPLKPAFVYPGQTTSLIITGILSMAGAAFLTLDGGATLITAYVPHLLPGKIEANLIRSAHDGPVKDGILLISLGVLSWIGIIWLLRVTWNKALGMRPLTINSRGVYAFYRGKPALFLQWENMTSITKRRFPLDNLLNPQTEIEINSREGKLLITSKLRDYGRARQLISRYALEHSIKLKMIDKGANTMKAQRKILAPEQYKQLVRTGVVMEISEL